MVAQYVVAAPKVENINFGWFSSGKLVAPKEDNIHTPFFYAHNKVKSAECVKNCWLLLNLCVYNK